MAWLCPLLVGLCLVLSGCKAIGGDAPAISVQPTVRPTTRPILAIASPSRASASPVALKPAVTASPSPAAARGLVYVGIGASDTVGVGASDPAREGWVPRFAQLLGPGTRLRNLGVSGTLIHTAVRDQLPAAVREQPDFVTVWLAVNDLDARTSLESYSADLDTLLGTLARQTHASVLVANVPNLVLVPKYQTVDQGPFTTEVALWNVAIADAALRHNAQLVDLYAHWAELARRPDYISSDGFHPSSAGYARVADLFFEASLRR
jgi:lysophospholipase L1-like esterase